MNAKNAAGSTGANPGGPLTYAASGVSIDRGNEVVERIRGWVGRTHAPNVLPGAHGGFGGCFELFAGGIDRAAFADPVLVGATDGVGTKLKIAFLLERYDTVGIDLVAMCVNDLIVPGAKPLFFLDYIGTGVVEPTVLEDVVKGVAEGCLQAGCSLLGGETAELPGFYAPGEFDLAGFSVGVVDRSRVLDGAQIAAGDLVIGLPSSGLHSNGYSLVRAVLVEGKDRAVLDRQHDDLGRSLGEELLEPTRIYVKPVLAVLGDPDTGRAVRALAHITGGGLVENIPRVLPAGHGVVLDRATWDVPPIFDLIQREGRVEGPEMDRVFNRGLGMVMIVEPGRADAAVALLVREGIEARVVGEVERGNGVRFG